MLSISPQRMANRNADVRNSSSWETFCREEARQWASAFLERVRSFKIRNPVSREVHDSAFTNEFSAAFLEESSILLTDSNSMFPHANGESTRFTSSMPSSQSQGILRSPTSGSEASSSSRKSTKAKSWISHLFKWSKSQKSRRSSPSSPSSSRQGCIRRNTEVLKEELVRMLNMNADNSSSSSAWQQCRLTLLKENTNHQLEIYSPSKNTVPKMSLFCFLIKEVRPATSLEIPDSTSCFVIKSQNHGEYVFDAGSEPKKQSWISNIRACSANLATPGTNGHLPGYSPGATRHRSHSIGPGDLRTPLASTLPRGLALPPPLVGGQGRRGSGPNRLAPPTAVETNSEESVLMDVSSFIRTSPNRSPSRRRKAQSMFVESTLATQLDTAVGRDAQTASQGVRFPYDSPAPSPPPVPKRGVRPKNIAVGISSNEMRTKSPPISPLITGPNERGIPQRRLSQPHIGLTVTSASELPSNLDTCSVSSSSSALHPVSLADIERRGPLSPSHFRYSSQLSILSEGHGATASKPRPTHARKISAPVLIPSQPYLDREVVHPEPQTTTIAKNHSSEQFFPPPPSNHDNDQSNPSNDDAATPRDRDEDMTSKATLSFPVNSRNNSPYLQRRHSSEDETQPNTRRRLVPYTRLNVSSLVGHINQTTPRESETQVVERPHSQASAHTEGSEEREASHPLYIETTESEGVTQPSTHTHHPYENWATNPQDVQNLRQLSQYMWFHGMISRNNASQLVLGEGDAGTGQYLVRQSESREGDFVLTFNYHNRAKHLRLTLDENGCNIQHLWFDDVPGMLEYFKTNSIPLESFWLNNDVKLTTFVDRKKSDTFRTTTVVNMTRLNRVPPRRSRSLHLSMSQAVTTNVDTSSPLDHSISVSSSNSSTSSLPQSARNGVGWRQLFRTQRSSSAGNMSVHGVRGGASVQRSHSTNAGSILDTRGRGGSGRGSSRNSQNNTYVYRNY